MANLVNKNKTHCPAGHPYDAENVYLSKAGARHCRECKRQRQREKYIPRKRIRKSHCVHGHQFDEQNTGWLKDGTRYCKTCSSLARKKRDPLAARLSCAKWRANNRHVTSRLNRVGQLRIYGITIELYDELHASQNGVCAICRNECSSGRRLAVDHNHASGVVRGLLCGACNTGLGKFRDSPELLATAAEYLMKTAKTEGAAKTA